MRLLFCCEFYFPSVGGVQEVMRQIAERMVMRGHQVTVATTRLTDRNFSELNGVKVVEFAVTGNQARGIKGEVKRYQDFVVGFPCDGLLIKAAQQWTFDALLPVLDRINARKVFIPCGFSGLYEPAFAQYFQDLPAILCRFDHLIFYAEHYRDIDFARAHGIGHFSVVPNGASELEFNVEPDPAFRARHAIPEDSFVLLTVGTLTGVKGHREIAEAFARMHTRGQHVTWIMNGNPPPRPAVDTTPPPPAAPSAPGAPSVPVAARARRLLAWAGGRVVRVAGLAYRSFGVVRREGLAGVRQRVLALTAGVLEPLAAHLGQANAVRRVARPLAYWLEQAQTQTKNKLLLQTDLPRGELVQAYMAADLFVFASNVEYSPLVLFEAAAAGTPFLSVPVGNAEEIARWTGGGIICPAPKDEHGYTRVEPLVLAQAIEEAMRGREHLRAMGKRARAAWLQQFTWGVIAERYEQLLQGAPATAHATPIRQSGRS
ncbi:MAG: glycosyltransferase family 4 protein [Candidatus Accumulibacter propinquus]|jgi:glycosyltransferase involved in cell wall biosynthesis